MRIIISKMYGKNKKGETEKGEVAGKGFMGKWEDWLGAVPGGKGKAARREKKRGDWLGAVPGSKVESYQKEEETNFLVTPLASGLVF